MWTNGQRLKRDLALFLVVAFAGGASAIVALVSARPLAILVAAVGFVAFLASLRLLMRCARCGRSVLWWSASHSPRGECLSVLVATTACPYCGNDDEEP